MKVCIQKILLALLVINFILLVVALTQFVPNNPLQEYRFVLGVSFIVIAVFARKNCPKSGKGNGTKAIVD